MNYNKIFEEAHKAGAEEFGFNWISANESAIEVAQEFDLEDVVPKLYFKALLSKIVLAVLQSQVHETP